LIDSAVRALVWQRAGSCCEYCRLAQRDTPFRTFHIDHIVPRKHGGRNDPDNLALACDRCSLHKGSNLAGIDDETGVITPLFHPRTENWEDHFGPEGIRIIGLTPTGRATVRVCGMNLPRRLRLRLTLQIRR
jgi:5-methylcytosine-specific restriction endonuclease McrA